MKAVGSVDFLVKLRDVATMMADACNEELEKRAPSEAQEHKWDPSKIPWREAEGARGKYERYPAENEKAEATHDYKNMLADLRDHGDKMTRESYFYWLFRDGATVGRKKKQK